MSRRYTVGTVMVCIFHVAKLIDYKAENVGIELESFA